MQWIPSRIDIHFHVDKIVVEVITGLSEDESNKIIKDLKELDKLATPIIKDKESTRKVE